MSDKRVKHADCSVPPERCQTALAAFKVDFRVVVFFDTKRCEENAMTVMWRLLAKTRPATRIDVRCWQCETMKLNTDWTQLHSDLLQASAIIVATEGPLSLEFNAAHWGSSIVTIQTEIGEILLAVFDRARPFLRETFA